MNNKIIAYVLLVIGGINMLTGLGGGIVASVIIGGVFLFAGSRILRNSQKAIKGSYPLQQATKFELNDEMIIRLAKRMGGKLTVEELSAQTSLTREKAQERLEQLLGKGLCDIVVNDEGKIHYTF